VVGAGVQGFSAAGTSLLYALPTQETQQPAGQKVVEAVRTAVDGRHDVIGVGGPGAQMHDFDHAIYGNFWKMIVVIAFVTFALLALALRSILLPLKAIAVNLLSVAAAFGGMVLIWQKGYGSSQIWGVDASGTITFWVPVFVFAFLFGLSMDYEVFILSRVREEYDRTGSTHEAMTRGLARTGRLVSCAALILAFAFLAMSTGPQTDIKILATGLGVGILLDATVVRCVLVPALVALFGPANWWLPGGSPRRSPVEPVPAPDAELV
jgi:RND superfamily putative drug exporter